MDPGHTTRRKVEMSRWLITSAATAVLMGLAGAVLAQSGLAQPVPGAGAARDVPGAHELPDPTLTYKVVFDVSTAAAKIDDVNPGLAGAARYVNTLAKYGVPAEHRKIAIVVHRDATEIIVDNETFKTRNDGHDNPNLELIRKLKRAGVDLHVCGQAVLGKHIDPKTIVPEIQLDLWALTTLTTLELQGYVHVGG
jgi:intracellular sulfur oxidation DsrE/DsrF family protein